jgi:hypothetical protein
LIQQKPHHQFLVGENTKRQQRLLYLASRIQELYDLVKNDPNKATSIAFVLTAKHRRMIEALKPVLGVRSREAVFQKALESIYARHFVQ